MTPFSDLIKTVKQLRSENGCPWDKEQTHQSLRRHLLEESYEVLEVIDKNGSDEEFCEELGDLLFQVLLHAELAEERGAFSITDIATKLNQKLIRRHPHVFDIQKLQNSAEVIEQWDKLKEKEKKRNSVFDGIPNDLPALQKSEKIISKVTKVGFQWDTVDGPIEKLEEELQELKLEIAKISTQSLVTRKIASEISQDLKQKIFDELGDVLFCSANIAYFFAINPEDALRAMLHRFERRFRFIETAVKNSGRRLEELSLAEMDVIWTQAKQAEKS